MPTSVIRPSVAVDVIKSSSNEIQGIVTESKSGPQAILARRVKGKSEAPTARSVR